jgi:hypothetical protein
MSGVAPDRLELHLAVRPDPEDDAEEIDRMNRQLRARLQELDVDDVTPVGDGALPAGAKGADAASMGELLVTMSAGGGVFVTVLATVRDWLGRRSGAQGVTLTIDGDTLELTRATAAERAELVEAFVRRHGGS